MASGVKFYFVVAVCLIVIGGLGLSLADSGRPQSRLVQTQEELDRLEAEVTRLEKEKAWVESDDYLETAARDQLGLAKTGETVVVLPESLREVRKPSPPAKIPNWRKWLEVFWY